MTLLFKISSLLIAICFFQLISFPSEIFIVRYYRMLSLRPDQEKSYTKAKLQSLQENSENISPNQGDSNTELFLPQDERATQTLKVWVMGMMQFVHDLQVYKEPRKNHIFVRPPIKEIANTSYKIK